MKKTILTTFAIVAMATGAFAQGSISGIGSMFNNAALTFGPNQSSTTTATAYYGGGTTFSLQVFYAPTASVTAGQITAINALDGAANGGQLALALLNTDGFALVSATTLATSGATAGAVTEGYNGNNFTGANQINLLSPTATSATAWLALYVISSNAGTVNWSGAVAFSSGTGGNPYASIPGTPQVLSKDPAGLNIDMTAPVPEPTTLTLAGLGGAALMAIRRRKA
jgi:hypothetical protein